MRSSIAISVPNVVNTSGPSVNLSALAAAVCTLQLKADGASEVALEASLNDVDFVEIARYTGSSAGRLDDVESAVFPYVRARRIAGVTPVTLLIAGENQAGLPGGEDGRVQYNAGGTLAGSAELVWDPLLKRLGVDEATPAATLHIGGAALLETGLIPDLPAGGPIGGAPPTVDQISFFRCEQTTPGQALSLPSPTNIIPGRLGVLINGGSVPFDFTNGTVGVTVLVGSAKWAIWTGSLWAIVL